MTLPLLSTARLTFLPSGVETIARLLSRQLIRYVGQNPGQRYMHCLELFSHKS